jgi:hypothetical protein
LRVFKLPPASDQFTPSYRHGLRESRKFGLGEIDWSGFQLDVSSAVVAPEPGSVGLLVEGMGLLVLCMFRKLIP